MDWMPKYVSAAARSCRSSALYSFSARFAASSHEPPLRSVGSAGTSTPDGLAEVCDPVISSNSPHASSWLLVLVARGVAPIPTSAFVPKGSSAARPARSSGGCRATTSGCRS